MITIGWVFPQTDFCGISIYSRNYIKAFTPSARVICFDPFSILSDNAMVQSDMAKVDLFHIQYETSFFMLNDSDMYGEILSKLQKPRLVSLHEIYEQHPGVFPRSSISGPKIIKWFKQCLYDRRHPAQTAFRKHLRIRFGANNLLVHHHFHKEILVKEGVPPESISLLPHPVPVVKSPPFFQGTDSIIRLGTTGFINPNYDYELLFSVLRSASFPWRFTWIGGIRTSDQTDTLHTLQKAISDNGWEDRFTITGWVSEKAQDEQLSSIDTYLALFKNRSSSGSLARALGAQKMIITTPMPLTQELTVQSGSDTVSGPVLICSSSEEILSAISRLRTNPALREELLKQVRRYAEEKSYENMAARLYSRYQELLQR